MIYILLLFGSIIYSEFVGYFLHIFIHSEKIAWLSKNHMQHHLRDYSPRDKMRTEEYKSGSRDRTNVLGLGMEWVIPAAFILAALFGGLTLLGLPWYQQLFSATCAVLWSNLMFNYMHAAMHEKKFWMLNVPILGTWFKKVRRLHDIHHIHVAPEGKLNMNYGICFFVMDRIFGTFGTKPGRSKEGFEKALERYKDII